MKVKFLSMLSILCFVSSFVSCNAANKKTTKYSIQPDSTVYYTLGKTMSDILFSPTKVTCYTIQGKSTVSETDFELEPHYVRDSLIAKLDDEQISILQFNLLTDDANYHQDSLRVRSPYVPCVEFCFEKKKQQPVHIIVSLSDFSRSACRVQASSSWGKRLFSCSNCTFRSFSWDCVLRMFCKCVRIV